MCAVWCRYRGEVISVHPRRVSTRCAGRRVQRNGQYRETDRGATEGAEKVASRRHDVTSAER